MTFYCNQHDGYKVMKPTQSSTVVPVIGNGFDYESAINKPKINGVELVGDKTNEDILISSISNEEIEAIFKSQETRK